MKKVIVLVFAAVFLCSAPAFALQATFFGEDTGLGEDTPLAIPGGIPNSLAAQADFLSNLVGVGTEDFEGFAFGTSAPLTLTFPGAGTATLEGGGYVNTVPVGQTNGVGRYAVSGTNYWETTDVFAIEFSAPVAAFGFFGVDIGDFGGQVTVTTANSVEVVYAIPNTINGPGGSVLYFGLIDTDNPFVKVTFGNTASGVDFFGFDDMTIGSVEQVQPAIPEPGTMLLLGSGLVGLAGLGRRKFFKK